MNRLSLPPKKKRRPMSPEAKANISRSLIGRKFSEATKEKMRAAYRARLWTKDSGVPRPT